MTRRTIDQLFGNDPLGFKAARKKAARKTYTIAHHDGLLLATVPSGENIVATVDATAKEARIEVDYSTLKIEFCLTLTDHPRADDEIVWRGESMGFLTDEAGKIHAYAVRRSDNWVEAIKTETGWTVEIYKDRGVDKGRTIVATLCGGALGEQLARLVAETVAEAHGITNIEIQP